MLVEGADDDGFIDALLKQDAIQGIQTLWADGKVRDKIELLVKVPGFHLVTSLGIVADADGDSAASFQTICTRLQRAGLPVPPILEQFTGNPRIGVFLFPGGGAPGMLEDLCIATVQGTPAMACVNAFAACSSALATPPGNPAKSKAKAYLAAMPDSVPHVGIAAAKGYWNLRSAVVDPLRAFLRSV